MTKLIHVAKIQPPKKGQIFLFLREDSGNKYTWYEEKGGTEEITEISASSPSIAIRAAYKHWVDCSFRTLRCGRRFELPERDEHGCDALFHQMAASYTNSGGVYFDENLSQNCVVNDASDEAIDLWKKLLQESRI
ncbi:MAG: hypothetical protein ACI9YB_002595 [Halioglobus sp.]|jgi:hypothetical protein